MRNGSDGFRFVRRTALRILFVPNRMIPRHDSSKTSSWCLSPLPPFTNPRSRIRQRRPLLIRVSLMFAKRHIAHRMHR
jgi:hypothetical protein